MEEHELSPERQESMVRFRETLQRIDSLENLRQTQKIMDDIAAGRVDPEDKHVKKAIAERIDELEQL